METKRVVDVVGTGCMGKKKYNAAKPTTTHAYKGFAEKGP